MTSYQERLLYTASPNVPRCIFCGAPPPMTGEHIFPHWSHKYLPPESDKGNYESLRGVRNPLSAKRFEIIKPGDIRHWRVRCVCTSCNNGWMRSFIEDGAIPILTPLIRGDDVKIYPPDQSRIAVWAAMKAMVAEYNVARHATTNHMQRKYLMRHYLAPKGWGIWIGHFLPRGDARYKTLWQSNPFLLLPDKQAARYGDKRATYYNSQATTILIGQLLIHILRSPMPNLVPRWHFNVPDRGTLFRIWPPAKTFISWPAKTLSDDDAIFVANAFMNFMLNIQQRSHPAGGWI